MYYTYCGNNLYDLRTNSNARLGTRYECFKKGIGVGQTLPYKRYKSIDKTDKIYCGNKKKLPNGYDYLGTRNECLRKGVGVGRSLKKKKSKKITKKRNSNRLGKT